MEKAPSQAAQLWAEEIRPLFEKHCQDCHGGAKQEAELDLRQPNAFFPGASHGRAADSIDPLSSPLWHVVQPDAEPRMPPDGEPLSEQERDSLQRWLTALQHERETLADVAWSKTDTRLPWVIDESRIPSPDLAATEVIETLIADGWQQQVITPAPGIDDAQFVRRLYLDLLGRIPSLEEREAFLNDPDPERRSQLIDRLLEHPEHSKYLAEIFDTVLLGRARGERMKARHENGWIGFLERSFASNRPWDQVLRAIVLARPESTEDRGATWFLYERDGKTQEIAEAISPAMFGVQIQCAQCHDHPLAAEIGQRHYWGLVAFFNRSKNSLTPRGPQVSESAIGGFSSFANLEGVATPNLLEFLGKPPVAEARPADLTVEQTDAPELYRAPEPFEGSVEGLPQVPVFSRRHAFADQVLAGHPLVARAMVNRIWTLLMGRGLVHPVDKLDSTHPPSHPELLDWLSRDFERSGYDVRRLMRNIVSSEVYALDSLKPSPSTPPAAFAYGLEKPLSAESLHRSWAIGLFGTVDDRSSEIRRSLTETFPDLFPEEIVTTVTQTLYLSNHPDLNALFQPRDGNLTEQALATSRDAAIRLIFLRLLGREPATDELEAGLEFLESSPDSPQTVMVSLVWAVATSAEFRFNH